MGLKDSRGVPVSTADRESLEGYERAAGLLHGYFNDPLAAIDATLARDPSFVLGHCLRAALMLTATDKAAVPALRQSVEAGEALWDAANERERGHLRAARAWLEGDFQRAVALYGDVLVDHPRDLLALQIAHVGDFFLGQSSLLRDRVARVLPDWDEAVPGFGYVLGMHAFGLEEMGDYTQAEERGRRATALGARDPWAIHAVAHVMEMQGRLEDGIAWLGNSTADWSEENGFAFHNWWHLALFHLDRGEIDRVLELYDRRIRPARSELPLEMLDATALLWRLHLRGADVGPRWRELADAWAAKAEDAYYVFNDMHAMMAFVADARPEAADALLAALAGCAAAGGTNAMMVGEVGLPVCRAIHAFGRGGFDQAVDLLMPVRAIAHRFGGSHAQRDVLSLTLIEAALRAGRGRLARALAAERTALKPGSPFNWRLAARADELAGDAAGAAAARQRAAALGPPARQ